MINGYPINELEINGINPPVEVSFGILSLGGYSFCGDDISFNTDNLWSSGSIDIETSDNSQSNWWQLIQQLIRNKTINLTVMIKAANQAALQAKIDEVKWAVYVRETELINIWNGEFRALKVTTNWVIDVNYRSNYSAEISFQLFANNPPNWYSASAITVFESGIVGDHVFTITNNGNLDVRPKYYFIFSGATSLTGFTMTIWGYDIIITTAIAAGDVIIIDTMEAQVTKNDVVIGTRWPLTIGLEPWDNNIELDFTWSTVACALTIVYNQQYL